MVNILVIEDDHEINNLLCKALKNQGYTVQSAYTGPAGLDCLRQKLKKANEKEDYIDTLWGLGYRLAK